MEPAKSTSNEWTCVQLNDSYVWQPARVNTFVLPVIEIEAIIVDLQRIANSNTITVQVREQLNGQIDNWNSILTKYRSYNDGLSLRNTFSEMDAQWNTIVNSLAKGDLSVFDQKYDVRLIRQGVQDLLGQL